MAIVADKPTVFKAQLLVGENGIGEVGFADSVAANEKTGNLSNSDLCDTGRVYDLFTKDSDEITLGFGEFGGNKYRGLDNIIITIGAPEPCLSDISFTCTWDDTRNKYIGNNQAAADRIRNNLKNILDITFTV